MGDLERDGYTVLERFADPAAVAPLVEARLRVDDGPACARPHNTLVPLGWQDTIVRRLLASADRVREAAGARDLRWISGYVSFKEPRSPALWWHQDWWCWEHPVSYRAAAAQVAAVCYLGATDTARGALRLLPGSHRRSAPIHALLPEAHAGETIDPAHPAMADLPGQVTPVLRAGDAVLMDYRLLHGTHANAGDRRRDAVILNFAPDWGGLPEDIRAHLISHPCLPPDGDATPLLPSYDGERRDLPLSRDAPARFAMRG
jgi:hypothetical protein